MDQTIDIQRQCRKKCNQHIQGQEKRTMMEESDSVAQGHEGSHDRVKASFLSSALPLHLIISVQFFNYPWMAVMKP